MKIESMRASASSSLRSWVSFCSTVCGRAPKRKLFRGLAVLCLWCLHFILDVSSNRPDRPPATGAAACLSFSRLAEPTVRWLKMVSWCKMMQNIHIESNSVSVPCSLLSIQRAIRELQESPRSKLLCIPKQTSSSAKKTRTPCSDVGKNGHPPAQWFDSGLIFIAKLWRIFRNWHFFVMLLARAFANKELSPTREKKNRKPSR